MSVSNKLIAGFFLACALLVALLFTLPKETMQLSEVQLKFSGEKKNKIIFDKIKGAVEPYTSALLGNYVWDVSLNEIVSRVKADGRVESVSVRRRLPNKLELTITPHKPKAVLVKGNSRQSFFPVANDGSLLPAVKISEMNDLPLLRGTKFGKEKKLRFEALKLIDSLPTEGELSAIKISEVLTSSAKGFTLVLTNQGERVHMGRNDFAVKSVMVERVLNYLNKEGLRGRVIDARFAKKVVVRLRNAP